MPRVGLFATCLVDLFRPSVGLAAVKLLHAAGCEVEVPRAQTCCGQPAFNSGDLVSARRIAASVVNTFNSYDYVVVPSGSCAAMIRTHFPVLLRDAGGDGNGDGNDNDNAAAVTPATAASQSLSAKTWELTSFLHEVCNFTGLGAACNASVTYHDSCSGLRECGIRKQPRALLGHVRGLQLREMPDTDVCCGFGGAFCVKYAELASRLAADKITCIKQSGATWLSGGDLGCLMHIAAQARRQGTDVRAYHVAEVLAGMTAVPPIGEIDRRPRATLSTDRDGHS